MLTKDQLDAIKNEIMIAINAAEPVVAALEPGLNPVYMIVGKAVAIAIPSLIEDVQNLVSAKEPSDADSSALIQEARLLASEDPDSIV